MLTRIFRPIEEIQLLYMQLPMAWLMLRICCWGQVSTHLYSKMFALYGLIWLPLLSFCHPRYCSALIYSLFPLWGFPWQVLPWFLDIFTFSVSLYCDSLNRCTGESPGCWWMDSTYAGSAKRLCGCCVCITWCRSVYFFSFFLQSTSTCFLIPRVRIFHSIRSNCKETDILSKP